MRIFKSELAQKIGKLESVVPKSTPMPAMQGILVKEGYLIATNLELTVKTKIEGTEDGSFLIPQRAFDFIKNLPDGEVEISSIAKDMIVIKTDRIENKYQTADLDGFPTTNVQDGGDELAIKAETLLRSMRRVSYAVPAKNTNTVMTAMCLQASEGHLNFVGLDGHMLAWDQMDHDGDFELLIPKSAVEKLKTIGLSGEVRIRHGKTGAAFITDEFEVYTRLVEGEYFKYRKMFSDLPLHTVVSRTDLIDAMTRAKMCAGEMNPVRFELDSSSLCLSIRDSITDYRETVDLQEKMKEPLTIGFNARLVLETLKAFDCDNVGISFGGPRSPMIIEAEDSDFKAIVLPVAII